MPRRIAFSLLCVAMMAGCSSQSGAPSAVAKDRATLNTPIPSARPSKNYSVESAIDSLADAVPKADDMASKAGGTAAAAFRQVAHDLNSGAEQIQDFETTGKASEVRLAVKALSDASSVLTRLSINAPKPFQNDLQAIQGDVQDAQDSLKDAEFSTEEIK